jgi:hypothetical protein
MNSHCRIDSRGRLRGLLRGQTYAEFMMVVLPTTVDPVVPWSVSVTLTV